MHITHVENFKTWLVENIRPLCDADPIPLSKYVLALVKKDKDEKELKSICNDQLDVFFQENTVEFVEKLFQVLKDESYLSSQLGAVGAPSAATPAATGDPLPPQSQPPEDEKQRTGVKRKASAGIGAAASTALSSTGAPSGGNSVKSSGKPPDSKVARVAEASSAAMKQPPVPIRAPTPPPQLQSQHHQQQQQQTAKDLRSTLNSRSSSAGNSTGASSRHHHHQNVQQQQQQIQALHNTQHQQGSQQLPGMPAPMPPFQQQPSMPPPFLPMSAPQGFYPPPQMLLPPMPPLPPPPPPPPLPTSGRPRCRDYDEKGVCLLGAACPYDHGAHPVTVAPGDPAYGKFFPGAASGMQQQQQHRVIPPPSPHVPGGYAPVMSNITPTNAGPADSGSSVHRSLPQQQPQQLPIPPPPVVVQPAASSAAVQPAGVIPIVLGSVPHQQQHQLHLHHQPQMPHHHNQQPHHPQHHQQLQQATSNRIVQPIIGGGVGNDPAADAAASPAADSALTCTVELRRIPANLNNPASLGSHFCRFGTVLDIQTTNEPGDMADVGGHAPLPPDSARVTFSSPAEALAAYRCPEAVLNNRFIRMFLPGSGGGGGGGGHQRLSAKERLGARHQNAQQHQQQQQQPRRRVNLRQTSVSSSEGGGGDGADASESQVAATGAAPSRASLTWTPNSAEATAKAAEAAAAAAVERKQEGVRIQQAQRAALERAKAHRELRVKQIRMLKDCKESLAKLGTLFSKAKDTEARHAIAETMKPINAQIRDLESSLGVVSTGSVALRDLQKELLDLELEIYQKEGLEPVVDQKKRLAEVRKQLAARLPQQQQKMPGGVGGTLHGPGGSGGGAGAGAAGGTASGGVPTFAQTRLDKRSRTLKVAAGFSGVGQVEDLLRQIAQQSGVKPQGHQQTPDGHQLLVDFATRAEAEAALARFPKSLDPDRPYKVEWSQALAVPAKLAPVEPAAASTRTSE